MSTSYIYKITNIINGSIYIGQTTQKNIEVRFNQHLKESRGSRSDMVLLKAIRKYGEESFTIVELESVSPHSQEKLDELEIFYIDKFKAARTPNYNMKTGGANGSNLRGKYGIDLAEKIANEIEETSKTFVQIGKEYKVPSSYVSDINCGEIFPTLRDVYPIDNRNTKKFFSEQEIEEIYSLLRIGTPSTKIATMFNVSNVSISNINNGLSYRRSETDYPIHKAKNSKKRLKIEDIKTIVELLKEGLTYSKIDKNYGYSRKTVSNVNNGTSYKKYLSELGICDFPIKK